jgi:chorismate mutase
MSRHHPDRRRNSIGSASKRNDGSSLPRSHVITLRTARVIVENLDRHDAVTKMLRSIVNTERADYDNLTSTTYTNDNDADDAAHAAAPRRIDKQNRVPRMDH